MDVEDLQAALDYNRKYRLTASEGDAKDDEMFDIIVEAARMWLNPNIEAAARLGVVWDELTEKERVIRMAYVKPYVMAALTPGDTKSEEKL